MRSRRGPRVVTAWRGVKTVGFVRLVALLLCLSTLACDPLDRDPSDVLAQSDPPPNSSLSLSVESDLPLQLRHVEEVDSTRWVGVDQSWELWLISRHAEKLDVRLLQHSQPWVPTGRIADIVRTTTGMLLVEPGGTAVLVDTAAWHHVAGARFEVEGEDDQILQVEVLSDNSLAVLSHRFQRNARGSVARLPVVQHHTRNGEIIAELWRGDPITANAPEASFDQISFAVVGENVVIGGSTPPRLYSVSWLTPGPPQESVLDSPRRPISDQIRQEFGRMLRRVPKDRRLQLQLPRFLPAVLKLRGFGLGLVVVSITGGNSGEAEGVDWYCHGRFVRTLLHGVDLDRIHLLPSGVMTIRDQPVRESYLLEFYEYGSLRPSS